MPIKEYTDSLHIYLYKPDNEMPLIATTLLLFRQTVKLKVYAKLWIIEISRVFSISASNFYIYLNISLSA